MFKNIFNDLKLNRISYLLEIIEKQNFKKKVDAFNKLKKIKINEEAGHLIIDKVMDLKHKDIDNFNADISLLSLVLNNYYDSYSEHLFKAFKKLNTDTKTEFLSILASSNEPSELVLYRSIIYTYYKDINVYPIGTIASDSDNYELVFPELYESFKSKNNRNNILLLLSDFINLGAVPLHHLNKYKKVLQKIIINILKEGIKSKLDAKENFMNNKEYIDLRIFLEVAINIEYYVSNKETKSCLEKLYKTKDNQLKLFILENYARKGMDLSKINVNSIAKDNSSRQPLYSFLEYNKQTNLMPKKYRNNKSISLSDVYLNYSISVGYTNVPYDFELIEERIVNDYKYYIYKFKTSFNYNEEIIDPVTDYLLKNIKIDDDLIKNGETTYIGISGGYNKLNDPSLIEKPLAGIKIAKFNDNYEEIVNKILNIKEEKIIEKELVPLETKYEYEEEIEKKFSKITRIFSFSKILIVACISILFLFVVLLLYVSNIDLFNIRKHTLKKPNVVQAVALKEKESFVEINYNEIFNREESEYYVLFFKKKSKSTYYEYLDTLLKKDYKVYYVDLSKKENKAIYEGNETGFVIHDDTLLKVKDHEYSFYVIGKTNIIKEFKSYVDEIKKQEEKEKKEKEQAKKKAEEKKTENKKKKS